MSTTNSTKSETVTVTVYESQDRTTVFDWPPAGAPEFLKWVKAKLDAVPPEHMPSARIEFGACGGYDGPEATLVIYYDRPETAEEQALREKEDLHFQETKERLERQEFERLKAKYG